MKNRLIINTLSYKVEKVTSSQGSIRPINLNYNGPPGCLQRNISRLGKTGNTGRLTTQFCTSWVPHTPREDEKHSKKEKG